MNDLDTEPKGIECASCGCRHFEVVATRPTFDGKIRRRRECRHCGRRVTTVEEPLAVRAAEIAEAASSAADESHRPHRSQAVENDGTDETHKTDEQKPRGGRRRRKTKRRKRHV